VVSEIFETRKERGEQAVEAVGDGTEIQGDLV
jgi:hypothetical protein